MVADNLLSMTQNYFTPDIVQKFSRAIGQPAEKIQSGLKSIIPTFLLGLVNKGQTNEGAQNIVSMVQKQGFDAPTSPANVVDDSVQRKGQDVVNGIFGNNLSSVTSTLGTSTGLNSSNITKLMGMIAPVVMGVIGSKIKNDNLSPSGLMNFLSVQKSTLTSFLPSGLTNIFTSTATAASSIGGQIRSSYNDTLARTGSTYSTTAEAAKHEAGRKRSWAWLGLLALAVLGLLWWFGSRRANEAINRTETSTVTAPAASTIQPGAMLAQPGSDLGELGTFLASGSITELPKRFRFDALTFETGTTTLASGAEGELDQIANALKEYPTATARLEGFTDNTGDMTVNRDLSTKRASAVRDLLVARGVEASRIEAVGRADESPIASNDTEEGRSQNRRLEFVVTGL